MNRYTHGHEGIRINMHLHMLLTLIIDYSTNASVYRQEYSTKCYCWYCQLKLDYVCTSLHYYAKSFF